MGIIQGTGLLLAARDPIRTAMYADDPSLLPADLSAKWHGQQSSRGTQYSVNGYQGNRLPIIPPGLGTAAIGVLGLTGYGVGSHYLKNNWNSLKGMKSPFGGTIAQTHIAAKKYFKNIASKTVALNSMAFGGMAAGLAYSQITGDDATFSDMATGATLGTGLSFAMGYTKGTGNAFRKLNEWRILSSGLPSLEDFVKNAPNNIKFPVPGKGTKGLNILQKDYAATAAYLRKTKATIAGLKVPSPAAYASRLGLMGMGAISAAYLANYASAPLAFLRGDVHDFFSTQGGFLSFENIGALSYQHGPLTTAALLGAMGLAGGIFAGHLMGKAKVYAKGYADIMAGKLPKKPIKYRIFRDNAFFNAAKDLLVPTDVKVGGTVVKPGGVGSNYLRAVGTVRNLSIGIAAGAVGLGAIAGSSIDHMINFYKYLAHPGTKQEKSHTFTALGAGAGAIVGLPIMALGQAGLGLAKSIYRIRRAGDAGRLSKVIPKSIVPKTSKLGNFIDRFTNKLPTSKLDNFIDRFSNRINKLFGKYLPVKHPVNTDRIDEILKTGKVPKQQPLVRGGTNPVPVEQTVVFPAVKPPKPPKYLMGNKLNIETIGNKKTELSPATKDLIRLRKLIDRGMRASPTTTGYTSAESAIISKRGNLQRIIDAFTNKVNSLFGKPLPSLPKNARSGIIAKPPFKWKPIRQKIWRGTTYTPRKIFSGVNKGISTVSNLYKAANIKFPVGMQVAKEIARGGAKGLGFLGLAAAGTVVLASVGAEAITGKIADYLENVGNNIQTIQPTQTDFASAAKQFLPMNYALSTMTRQMNQRGPMPANNLNSAGVGLAAYRKRHQGWL